MKTDSVFYRLFQRLPGLVLELAEIDVADVDGYQFHSEEVKQTAFRLDGMMRPPEGSERPLIFVEVQYQRDPRFYRIAFPG
jgi:predicted transposase YdaD